MRSDLVAALEGRRIGAHLPLGTGLVRAVDRATAIGANTLQVFIDNPTAWRRRADPPDEVERFVACLDDRDVLPLAIHGPYLLNFASPDDAVWERSIATLVSDLRQGARWGAALLNVHLGSHRGSGVDAGIRRVGTAVARVLAETAGIAGAPRLVLENSAGGGDGIGGSVEELAGIQEAIVRAGGRLERTGFCLDTAHAWGAGYDIASPEGVDALLTGLVRAIGGGRLAMAHLNDSRSHRGSHTDRHEHVGAGLIGAAGLRSVLEHDALRGIPFYLETPGMDEGYDALNMERVRQLLAGETLPDLPRAAFAARGSRSRTAPQEP
jgi:deoxyribonuclease-4